MSGINFTSEMVERGKVMLFSWVALKSGDTGSSAQYPGFADRSFHVIGTWGGASVVIEGSNNGGANMCQLDDHNGVLAAATQDRIFGIAQACLYTRPRVVGGDGTTNLNVKLMVRT